MILRRILLAGCTLLGAATTVERRPRRPTRGRRTGGRRTRRRRLDPRRHRALADGGRRTAGQHLGDRRLGRLPAAGRAELQPSGRHPGHRTGDDGRRPRPVRPDPRDRRRLQRHQRHPGDRCDPRRGTGAGSDVGPVAHVSRGRGRTRTRYRGVQRHTARPCRGRSRPARARLGRDERRPPGVGRGRRLAPAGRRCAADGEPDRPGHRSPRRFPGPLPRRGELVRESFPRTRRRTPPPHRQAACIRCRHHIA